VAIPVRPAAGIANSISTPAKGSHSERQAAAKGSIEQSIAIAEERCCDKDNPEKQQYDKSSNSERRRRPPPIITDNACQQWD
jgi:hypothetical protein